MPRKVASIGPHDSGPVPCRIDECHVSASGTGDIGAINVDQFRSPDYGFLTGGVLIRIDMAAEFGEDFGSLAIVLSHASTLRLARILITAGKMLDL